MYYERLPAYEYALPCGHTIRSLTRSEPYRQRHHFYCRRCESPFALRTADLPETRPRNGAGRLSDPQLVIRIDAAIHADRVVAYYRAVWSDMTQDQVAAATGISLRVVERVAADLGVYEDASTLPLTCENSPARRSLV